MKSLEYKEARLKMAKQTALNKGGQCLSSAYVNNASKMEWKCSNPNHPSWLTGYSKVVCVGTWCPICGFGNSSIIRSNANGLELAKKYAISKGENVCLQVIVVP